MPIQYVGLDNLDEKDMEKLTSISEKAYPKLERYYPDETLVLVIKTHSKSQGTRAKISINGKIEAPKIKIIAQANDWDMAKAAHKIFDKLEEEAKRKLKR
ncbi:MAG: hypothetical protein AABX29_08895 [Nanoarchaeota archaeon]